MTSNLIQTRKSGLFLKILMNDNARKRFNNKTAKTLTLDGKKGRLYFAILVIKGHGRKCIPCDCDRNCLKIFNGVRYDRDHQIMDSAIGMNKIRCK